MRPSYLPLPTPVTEPTFVRHQDDYAQIFVTPSQCADGALGYFFTVDTGKRLRPGHLLGAYLAPNNRDLGITFEEFQRTCGDSDYVDSCPFSNLP